MKWQRAGKYHEDSECGRYRVTGFKVQGKWRFVAIRRRGEVALLVADSADKCKQACEQQQESTND